jgi:hypothetical protein
MHLRQAQVQLTPANTQNQPVDDRLMTIIGEARRSE